MRIVVLAAMVVLSSGCVLRYSQQQIDGTWYDDKLERGWFPPIDLALMTNDIPVGPGAVALSLEFFNQDLDVSAVPPMEDWQSISIRSVMLGGRFYPLIGGPILPYAGGGFGRTQLAAEWLEYTGGGFDPLFRCIAFCDNTDEVRGSLASGYHPYLAGGIELRPGFMKPSLLLEYRRDFNRGDDFYELSGTSYSVGLRWQFN